MTALPRVASSASRAARGGLVGHARHDTLPPPWRPLPLTRRAGLGARGAHALVAAPAAPRGGCASPSPRAPPASASSWRRCEAEGLRESALTSVVLVGPATLTATASASASLYYYVLTGVCLLLGFAGLAFGEPLVALARAPPPGELGRRGVAA